jgi:quercetin dioxygenase-like cupin family protein
MHQTARRTLAVGFSFLTLFLLTPLTMAQTQENPPPQPVTLECATGMNIQVLGRSAIGDGSQDLALVRVIFEPDGGIGAHTHPGTSTVTIESGEIGFTFLDDGEMTVKRTATANSEATDEPLPRDEEVALQPGDTFLEQGMVHSARNIGDGDATLVFAALVTTGEPLTMCVDPATPVASTHVGAR